LTEVIHQQAKLSPLSKKLLLALRGKEKTKEELIEFLWEHRYRPLHHDPLIYQAITRLRENLGSHGHWIEAISEGYRLMPAVELVSATAEVHALPKISPKEGHFFQLNTRQIRILRLFKQKEFLGVNDCIKVFKVSDMTIKRDLAFLLGLGLLVRHGRARATRYALRKTNGAYYTETQEDFI
jgi:DNA-binding winged helix-turn-helix (wHTH) protein